MNFSEWHRQPIEGDWSHRMNSTTLPETSKDQVVDFFQADDLEDD